MEDTAQLSLPEVTVAVTVITIIIVIIIVIKQGIHHQPSLLLAVPTKTKPQASQQRSSGQILDLQLCGSLTPA